jgi:hypothetical protein
MEPNPTPTQQISVEVALHPPFWPTTSGHNIDPKWNPKQDFLWKGSSGWKWSGAPCAPHARAPKRIHFGARFGVRARGARTQPRSSFILSHFDFFTKWTSRDQDMAYLHEEEIVHFRDSRIITTMWGSTVKVFPTPKELGPRTPFKGNLVKSVNDENEPLVWGYIRAVLILC